MRIFTLLLVLSTISTFAQEDTLSKNKKDWGRVYGGLETNIQRYFEDDGLGTQEPNDPLRSNSYLSLNYAIGGLTIGGQLEAYEENALLNYNPQFEGIDLGTYFVNYKTEKFDFTLGHFYEQFGSGMILRAWEDRALGINTALRGARVKYSPTYNTEFTILYGRQRSGFDVAKGDIFGFNAEFLLGETLNLYEKNQDLSIGLSYVGRYEELPFDNADYEELTNAFSFRADYMINSFYINTELNYKTKDGLLDVQNKLSPDFAKPGHAARLNFGYSKSGLGIDVSLRRLENMSFYSERQPSIYTASNGEITTSIDYLDKVVNFTPALTKQHHSQLANIYVYQAQNAVLFEDAAIMKAGETGGQIDLYYTFKKGTSLGGKYGTNISLNGSMWSNLPGTYTFNPPDYDTDFLGRGKKYFSDYNLSIKKKVNETWHLGFDYINQYYDQRFMGGGDLVKANVVVGEATYNFTNSRSIRLELEHMWATEDRKDWAAGTAEFNVNENLSFYVSDMWNYGNDDPDKQIHYYNFGGSYRRGASRIALNYGRQRGGLVCVGGVCRYVPESSGLSLSFNTAF
ncbi:DUF6029 family protein [Psychroflexus halocasei]|uniref:Uncharacterized protein n=1 Tax=Psychroflexus halocasei TaxID=908615 RepID=A0A1H4CLH4_9FLAO|nr:DUF6029 family protein [Psychroflexus halocasei]SEA61179.1 hypothetical protein SAMN05421540_10862 [Psychroflexus halocasei]